jgi:hypothetical protein
MKLLLIPPKYLLKSIYVIGIILPVRALNMAHLSTQHIKAIKDAAKKLLA